MIIPQLCYLTVRSLEQILIVEVDERIIPVGRIRTTDEQGRSTHRHDIPLFTHIEESTSKQSRTPVDAVQVPLRDEQLDVRIRTVGNHLRITVVLLSQSYRSCSITTLLFIVMQTQIVEIVTAALDELLILAEPATSDDLDRRINLPHRRTEVAHALLIAVDTHLPHLIVNLPILHVIGFRMTVCRSLRTPFIRGRSIAVAHPVHRILKNLIILLGRTLELHAHHDNRFRIHLTTEAYELIRTETVLVVVHPHPVCPALAVLLRTDTPFPVVLCHISSARPAHTSGMQLLHSLQDIRTESAQILTRLCGHRCHIHLYGATFHDDSEIAVETQFLN